MAFCSFFALRCSRVPGAEGLELLSFSCNVKAVRGLDYKRLRCWGGKNAWVPSVRAGSHTPPVSGPTPLVSPPLLCPTTFSPVQWADGQLTRIEVGARKTRPSPSRRGLADMEIDPTTFCSRDPVSPERRLFSHRANT